MESYLIAFMGVAALVTVSPGPDMAPMLRNVMRAGQPVVVPTAFGIVSGLRFSAAGSSLGIAALVAYGSALGRLGEVLTDGRVRRAIEAVTGTVLVGLGLRIATEP